MDIYNNRRSCLGQRNRQRDVTLLPSSVKHTNNSDFPVLLLFQHKIQGFPIMISSKNSKLIRANLEKSFVSRKLAPLSTLMYMRGLSARRKIDCVGWSSSGCELRRLITEPSDALLIAVLPRVETSDAIYECDVMAKGDLFRFELRSRIPASDRK